MENNEQQTESSERQTGYEPSHEATYCPEDNKLRLYPDWMDGDFDKEDAKAVGFRWASKQEVYVCPRWSLQAEKYLLELCGYIGDEDYSPQERAADRAERFSGYRDKRAGEAEGFADSFDAGPSAFGHQNAKRAERAARRHDRLRTRAVNQWDKAEYWQQRTAGVISNAKHRSRPDVRRRRIKKLEAEQRKHLKGLSEAQERFEQWQKIAAMEAARELLPVCENGYFDGNKASKEQVFISNVAGSGSYAGRVNMYHPDPECEAANEKAREIWRHGMGAYDLLIEDSFAGAPYRRLTPKEYADLYLEKVTAPNDSEYWQRWAQHYEMRLSYENAMLENEGGMAGNVEMAAGGFIGKYQIQKVNKSRASGRVTSVTVLAPAPGRYDKNGQPYSDENPRPIGEYNLNIEDCGEEVYKAPTADELAAFKAEQKAKKAKAPAKPKLLNPTNEDAARLQKLWNSQAKNHDPSKVVEMVQKKYSYYSGGDMVQTVGVDADGKYARYSDKPVAFKIRVAWRMYGADSVIILTDKPQKALPLEWARIEAPETTEEPATVSA